MYSNKFYISTNSFNLPWILASFLQTRKKMCGLSLQQCHNRTPKIYIVQVCHFKNLHSKEACFVLFRTEMFPGSHLPILLRWLRAKQVYYIILLALKVSIVYFSIISRLHRRWRRKHSENTRITPANFLTNIQCIYKWMVQFQKLTRNLFLTLHGLEKTHHAWWSQQSIRPSAHMLALPASMSGFPAWQPIRLSACPPASAVFGYFSCYAVFIFIRFFFLFCFERNGNSPVTRLSAGRVTNLEFKSWQDKVYLISKVSIAAAGSPELQSNRYRDQLPRK